jgi:dihydropteroate synthase
LPVVKELAGRIPVPISIDTYKAEVADACLAAGAAIVNDVTALGDATMAAVIVRHGAGLILMHMQGVPATMQANPHYDNVVAEVISFLAERMRIAEAAGIDKRQIVLDPGIGFGKRSAHNCELIAHLKALRGLGRPVCLGVSRKGLIGGILRDRPVERRLAGSLAFLCFALAQDAVQLARVHDVEATRDVITIFERLNASRD